MYASLLSCCLHRRCSLFEKDFYDDDAVLFDDPDHSVGEERFLIIGMLKSSKICIVSHCYRDNDNVIRIISARTATKNEKSTYLKGW